jgi:hypothetical protein
MDDIIYQLSIEDIQTVAQEVLERDLTKEEIEIIIDPIADRINWFDIIEAAINEKIH